MKVFNAQNSTLRAFVFAKSLIMFLKSTALASSFSMLNTGKSVSIACACDCNLPVTFASAVRSFSKLKLIKNFTRSTMTQEIWFPLIKKRPKKPNSSK